MSDNVKDLMLEHLVALRSEVANLRTEMHAEFGDVKTRLSSLEAMSIGQRRDTVTQQEDI